MNIKFFKDIKEDYEVGGKGASLVKMYQNNFNIPNGYIITADLFDEFLVQNHIKEKIKKIIAKCNINNEKEIEDNSKEIVQIISKCEISDVVKNEIINNYRKLDGVKAIQSIDDLKQGMQSMLETMKTMVVLLIVVSAILGFVIIYNLGILSFSEKQYQFATLKVLGFKSKQIKKIFIKQNIWLTVASIIIGLPLGFIMTDYIFKSALGDAYDFNAQIKFISYVYAIVGTYIVSIFVNKILAKKVKTIDMVTSLKGNE